MNHKLKEASVNAIDFLCDIVKKNRDHEFLIDSQSGKCLNYGKFHELSLAVAKDLSGRGLKKGDRVAVLLENSIAAALVYFGCLYQGIVVVPINPAFAYQDINFIIRHSGAVYLVVSKITASKINLAVLKTIGIKILQVNQEDVKTKLSDLLEIWNIFNLPPAQDLQPFKDVQPEDTLTIIYTSGTTAKPKGVVHRISNLIDNARLFTQELELNEKNRFYGILSMTYLGGYYNLLLLPYTAGSSIVLSRAFDAQSALDFWGPAIKYEVNTLWLVPTIMSILLKMDRGKDGENFCRQKVKCALVGTAPLPVKLRKDFEEKYGIILYENYGLSETLFISTNSPKIPRQDGCVGRVLPGVQVTILDDKGIAMPYGEEKEIYVRTPFLMKGYYNSDSQSPDFLDSNSWFATGDIGVLTGSGDLFITDRKKDLIIRGGINISPMAIENILHEHPAIEKAVVVGVPHEIYGEEVAVVVKLKEGYHFNDAVEDIRRHCRKHTGAIHKVEYILEIDEFPLGPTGKVLKRQIQEMVIKKLKLPVAAPMPPLGAKSFVQKPPMMVPGRICQVVKRPNQKSIERLQKYSTSIISDCLNRMYVMDGRIHSLTPGRLLCGPALTIEEVEGGNLMSHVALELLQPGDILVIDAKGVITRACWGGLQSYMAKLRKAGGIVVFGVIRDLEEVVKSKLPVFALGTCPAGPLKGWGGNINYPISCAGVVVNPGDVIVGDDDGVVVVPKEMIDKVLPFCEQRATMENEWFKEVESGKATLDIVGLREKIKEFKIKYE